LEKQEKQQQMAKGMEIQSKMLTMAPIAAVIV
jgi:hypothetical protein